MLFSVIVPVFGCRGALMELHQRLTTTLNKITQEALAEYEEMKQHPEKYKRYSTFQESL